MINPQDTRLSGYQKAFIEATEKVKAKERKNLFYITKNSANSQTEHQRLQGALTYCSHLRITPKEQKNSTETVSYILAEGKKASDAVITLLDNENSGCSMTCQMASQLCTYYAILETMGVERFDKIFTDTLPLILRDFSPKAGQPFFSAPPFSGSRLPQWANVAAHPLALFLDQTKGASMEVGDTVIFTNVPEYTPTLKQATLKNDKLTKTAMRRMEAMCIANRGEPLFYSFGNMTDALNHRAMAQLMADAHNTNLRIISPNATPIKADDVIESDQNFQLYHYRINASLLDYFMTQTDEAMKNLAGYKKSLADELKMINKLPGNNVALRTELIENMSTMGKKWRQEQNYPGAITAFTAAASESLRSFEINDVSARTVQSIANLFHELAITHELAGSTLNAWRFARMAYELPSNVSIPSIAEHVATHERIASALHSGVSNANRQ